MTRMLSLALIVLVSLAGRSWANYPVYHYGHEKPAVTDRWDNKIIVIYSPGSTFDHEQNPCEMSIINSGFGVPAVVHAINFTVLDGLNVLVDGFCGSGKPSSFRPGESPLNELRMLKRAEEIARRARAYHRLGVPGERIFLIGHSEGGWASLMVELDFPELANAVVAFSPAFAGMKGFRSPEWQQVRDLFARRLAQGTKLDALVYTVKGDEYENTEDLAFLEKVPHVHMVELNDKQIEGVPCTERDDEGILGPLAHGVFFRDCFITTQQDAIVDFLIGRLP